MVKQRRQGLPGGGQALLGQQRAHLHLQHRFGQRGQVGQFLLVTRLLGQLVTCGLVRVGNGRVDVNLGDFNTQLVVFGQGLRVFVHHLALAFGGQVARQVQGSLGPFEPHGIQRPFDVVKLEHAGGRPHALALIFGARHAAREYHGAQGQE